MKILIPILLIFSTIAQSQPSVSSIQLTYDSIKEVKNSIYQSGYATSNIGALTPLTIGTPGIGQNRIVRGTGDKEVIGINAPNANQPSSFYIINMTDGTMTFKPEASMTPENNIYGTTDILCHSGGSVHVNYIAADARWIVTGGDKVLDASTGDPSAAGVAAVFENLNTIPDLQGNINAFPFSNFDGYSGVVIAATTGTNPNIRGITAPTDLSKPTVKYIINDGSLRIRLLNENTNAAAADRFRCANAGSIDIQELGGSIMIMYDPSISRWRVITWRQ